MSRIGKLPITIPKTVNVIYNQKTITVIGKFGEMQKKIPNLLEIEQNNNTLIVSVRNRTRISNSLHGLYRTLINNMIIGVSEQFKLSLFLKGVGYRVSIQKESIVLNLGYSHPIEIKIPDGISVEIAQNVILNLTGPDKEKLGLFASKIRSWRPPEPYKGKGIFYEGETIKLKAGKSGKK